MTGEWYNTAGVPMRLAIGVIDAVVAGHRMVVGGPMCRRRSFLAVLTVLAALAPAPAAAQTPAEYESVLTVLGRAGDYKDGVLKVNIPRSALKVTIAQRSAPTPFGFGGWVALTKTSDGGEV